MNDTKSQTITWAFSIVPYLLVTWGYTNLTDGDLKGFWVAFGILIGIRLFFTVIETIGGSLSWRLYGKSVMVQKMVISLRTNNFPMREYSHDDLGNYLARIEEGQEYSPAIRSMAKEISKSLEVAENLGILPGLRLDSAWNAALDIYSPRQNAPQLTL